MGGINRGLFSGLHTLYLMLAHSFPLLTWYLFLNLNYIQ